MQNPKITEKYRSQLEKALGHLSYSYKKIGTLGTDPQTLQDAELEVWESFSSRFARVVDIYLTKFVRAVVQANDPGFRGVLRDYVNQGEKLGILVDADSWMDLRELRNIEAHTYAEELQVFLEKLRLHAPRLLALKVNNASQP